MDIDGQVHLVISDSRPGQRLWRVCSGGSCLVHRSLGVVMGHYRALLISQGREVGEG